MGLSNTSSFISEMFKINPVEHNKVKTTFHENNTIFGAREIFIVPFTVKLIVESTNIPKRQVEAYCDVL